MSGLDAAVTAVVRAARPYATAVTVALAAGARAEVRCFGRVGRERTAPTCTPDTVFELGSVSKTFTALLLAELAARGELAPDDPVEELLPLNWRLAEARSAEPIRLMHLATHTSGLPRLPPGLLAKAAPAWFSNPYEAYGDEQLREALTRTSVHDRPGSRYWYSNFGVGLLGRALAERGGLPYGELLTERVCGPLGLHDTTCAPDQPGRATGYRHGRALPPWRIPGLPGAGAVRASGADLLRYLRAHLDGGAGGLGETGLGAALRDVQRPRLRLPRSTDRIALVWMHRRSGDRDLYFHSGGTRGFTAFVGFSPDGSAAVAAVANTAPALDGRFVQAGYEALRVASRSE
ncbi:serine hydrolase domain-containing protein [Kitasatospora brasiliensis]|uniref:serine hydrolase domain-containing protein n=1 Tax=Kitasatospora brasiliensis TaxID=3058040 RepID=UPI0029304EE4|nr:serine hydrolase domain-containing protein [Kitasatospora sp. K002]